MKCCKCQSQNYEELVKPPDSVGFRCKDCGYEVIEPSYFIGDTANYMRAVALFSLGRDFTDEELSQMKEYAKAVLNKFE